jgi:hypothetical protein
MQMSDYNKVSNMAQELALIALRENDTMIKNLINDCIELLDEALEAEDDNRDDDLNMGDDDDEDN